MTEDDRATMATVVVELKYLRQDVEELSEQLKTTAGVHVTRAEWQLRNAHVDSVMSNLRHELNARRTPWPTVASVAVAAVALIVTLAMNL